ncbi:MAG: cytochrome b/b6 domain-containing protein, partial [bacterium]|nr:cytochrome b/b6 domain-containing protein [bacterium]
RAIYRKRQAEPSFVRLTRNERIQHGLLAASFIMLVITGFALKFGWTLPFLSGGFNSFLRSTLHRTFGVILIIDLFYNALYLLFTKRGRQVLKHLIPGWNDFIEAGLYLQYLIGRRAEKPLFGRFTYWEKMEYWSVVWGVIIMGGTGLLLWFKGWTSGFLPKWGLDIVTLIHYLEAILATLAIVFGHFYFVIANPDVSPMSFTWLSGRISKEVALEEHPKTYQDRIRVEEDKNK